MPRGPKPKPTALKMLSGSRSSRINQAEPSPAAEAPEPPSWLDEDALAEWERLSAELAAMGVLTRADGAALAIYCVTFSRWRLANAEIEEHGLVMNTDLGGIKPNPAVTIAAAAEATMLRVLASFGCDPSARSRITVQKTEVDDFAEFLKKRHA